MEGEAAEATHAHEVHQHEAHHHTKKTLREDFAAASKVSTELHVDKALFTPFSIGDVKKIQSTPDNQVS
jgi:D-hexose-6-phosphate mutarotase